MVEGRGFHAGQPLCTVGLCGDGRTRLASRPLYRKRGWKRQRGQAQPPGEMEAAVGSLQTGLH